MSECQHPAVCEGGYHHFHEDAQCGRCGRDLCPVCGATTDNKEMTMSDTLRVRAVPSDWDCGLESTNFGGDDPVYAIAIPGIGDRDYEDHYAAIVQRFAELLPDNEVDRDAMIERLDYIMDGRKYRCLECDNDTFKLVTRGIQLSVQDGKPADISSRHEIVARTMLDTTWECEGCHTEVQA